MSQNGKSDASDGSSAIGKINLRILPFLFFVIFAAFVDRTNVSYAALPMSSHLGLTASMFGFGAGIFFLGEALFSVPSTMAARRAGVHKWIPLLMVGWGTCASAMAFVTGPVAFYVLRFLLGVTESGVMPSMILAAALWWPESHRARVITGITSGTGVAMVVGAPLAAVLIEIEGALDLAGWRWLFLLEGLPVIAVGLVALLVFRPAPSPRDGSARAKSTGWPGRCKATRLDGQSPATMRPCRFRPISICCWSRPCSISRRPAQSRRLGSGCLRSVSNRSASRSATLDGCSRRSTSSA